jgi:hypothetical protein
MPWPTAKPKSKTSNLFVVITKVEVVIVPRKENAALKGLLQKTWYKDLRVHAITPPNPYPHP